MSAGCVSGDKGGGGGAFVGVARKRDGGGGWCGGGVSCVGVTGSKLESERKEAAHVLGLSLCPKLALLLRYDTQCGDLLIYKLCIN